MAQHMKKKDMTWRELFNRIEHYAKKDGDGVWDLPVCMWYGNEDKVMQEESAYTFSGIHTECLLYPSYQEAPVSDENWLMLDLNNTTN